MNNNSNFLLQNKCSFLITGGTGFIGKKLVSSLNKKGHKITILTRKNNTKNNTSNINFVKDINNLDFNFDVIINLCGAPISVFWSKKAKQEIHNSRIEITKNLISKINNTKTPPKLFISGSAIGYYGVSNDITFNEESKPLEQNLFSQQLCFDWENAALKINNLTRLVLIRTGIVIGNNGGIIKKMKLPFLSGLGGKIGSGNQPMSWIHVDDVVNAIEFIVNNQNIKGGLNLTSPNHTTNSEFSKILSYALNRPCFFDMPSFIAKLLFGKMAEELLLAGQIVEPKKLLDNNYEFLYKNLKEAIISSI